MGNDTKQHIYAAWSDAIPDLVKIGISADAENELNGANASEFVPGLVDGVIVQVDNVEDTFTKIRGILKDFHETKGWFAITREHASSVLLALADDSWEYGAGGDFSESNLTTTEGEKTSPRYPELGMRGKNISLEKFCQKAGIKPGDKFTSAYKNFHLIAVLLEDYNLRCGDIVGDFSDLCREKLGMDRYKRDFSSRAYWKYDGDSAPQYKGMRVNYIVKDLRSKNKE